jgi:glucans biosynthesis protein
MAEDFDRRTMLQGTAVSMLLASNAFGEPPSLKLSAPAAFSFEALKATAREIAALPYAAPPKPSPEIVGAIDYEAWGKIAFQMDRALYATGPGPYPISFFHLGKFFTKAVRVFLVEGEQAREVIYDRADFSMPADSIAAKMPAGSGFAGLRIQERRGGKLDWRKNDWAAFLGASYFRAIGELYQYGLSARGLALNTAVADRPEEFPDFTRFYVGESAGSDTVTLHALLEGPSVTGAYRFVMTRGKGVVMDIDAMLILRQPASRFGIAPATSMYWFSETKKPTAIDWRPEIHDSDGLAMWAGWGGRLWRPLNNPPHITASAFADENPKGFGLMQRDRVFDHYLDGVYYDRRPSLWVEPKGNWGKGAIHLIELPTDDEIHDNIVATWVPQTAPAPGTEFSIGYRLYWLADEPFPGPLARCVATRLGNGGQPGLPRPKNVRKFVVEFLGGPLTSLAFGTKPDMQLHCARGQFTDYRVIEPVPDGVAGHWRAQFDLAGVTGTEPVELSLYLTVDGKTASETWLYQYHPFESAM